MEALLCLPFLLLILALAMNMAHGWAVRHRAETAARFAVNHYADLLESGVPASEARSLARDATIRHWYPGSDETIVELQGSPNPLEVALGRSDTPDEGVGDVLGKIGDFLSGRARSEVRAPRAPPTGTLLPASPVTASHALDATTWTHDEVPLTFEGMTEVGADADFSNLAEVPIILAKYAAKGFFWFLGMKP